MLDDKLIKELAEDFKKAREKLKLTQAEVAEKAGMHVSYYARIERGEINLSAIKIGKISDVLRIKIMAKYQTTR